MVSKCVVNTPDSEIYRGVCLSAINGFCPSTIKRSQNLSHISKAEEMIFWDGFHSIEGQYYNLEDRFWKALDERSDFKHTPDVVCLDCFDQGCPPDIKDMGQNSGQWRGGLISMSRCDDCPCPHCPHCPDCPDCPHCPHCSHSTLSSWAHLVMTDSRGRALLASKLVNVSNLYISEACLVSGHTCSR